MISPLQKDFSEENAYFYKKVDYISPEYKYFYVFIRNVHALRRSTFFIKKNKNVIIFSEVPIGDKNYIT